MCSKKLRTKGEFTQNIGPKVYICIITNKNQTLFGFLEHRGPLLCQNNRDLIFGFLEHRGGGWP